MWSREFGGLGVGPGHGTLKLLGFGDARKIGDMLEVDDAESSPLVGKKRHHPEFSCNFVEALAFVGRYIIYPVMYVI